MVGHPHPTAAGSRATVLEGRGRTTVGHIVNQDVAGDMARARQEATIVRAGGIQAAGDVAVVAELPDLRG